MKKIMLIGILILTSEFMFGQPLKQGNLVGTHVITIELNPGVTMKEFQDFHLNTLIPADGKCILLKVSGAKIKTSMGGFWWLSLKRHAIDFTMIMEA